MKPHEILFTASGDKQAEFYARNLERYHSKTGKHPATLLKIEPVDEETFQRIKKDKESRKPPTIKAP